MQGVELTSHAGDGHVVVALRGELDITGAAGAEAAITVLIARGQCLVIDLSALDFLDCCSLSALQQVHARVRRGGGDLVLAAPQPLVRRLLALTGADDVFLVEASVDAAVAGIAPATRAVPLAAACGAHCTPSEGSAVASGTG